MLQVFQPLDEHYSFDLQGLWGLGNPYIDLAVRGCVGGERLVSEERGATSWFSKIGYEKF
jgi:hypothetical protein